jgi:SAM-dependent methyltransferase
MTGLDRATIADLRAYYEREAELGRRGPVGANRLAVRNEFIELLGREGRHRILDLGAGPGIDVIGFVEAGIECIGVDLAVGNSKLAAGRGLCVVTGSISTPPFRPSSFDAGWSMSTFMHVHEEDAANVARAMAEPLRAGAPLMVGLWGGARRDEIDTTQLEGEQRLFSLRPAELNGNLLSAAGATEHIETWDVGPDHWEYQLFLIRVGA